MTARDLTCWLLGVACGWLAVVGVCVIRYREDVRR